MLIFTLSQEFFQILKIPRKIILSAWYGEISILAVEEMHCGRKRGFMLKKGILFQGLPGEEGEGCKDITYLFLYTLSRNVLCRAKIRDMKREWREYLLKKADKSFYQIPDFWKMLKKEEKRCARIILGLLEDLRNCEDVRAEKAWICLRYLIRSGYRREEAYLRENQEISFSGLWKMTGREKENLLLKGGRICMCLLIAEEDNRTIKKDKESFLLESCVKKAADTWGKGEKREYRDFYAKDRQESLCIFVPFLFCISRMPERVERLGR